MKLLKKIRLVITIRFILIQNNIVQNLQYKLIQF